MTLVETALALVVDAALGGWFGVMVFFSFVGAPRAFQTLEEDAAGRYVNATFPTYYVVGVAAGALALAGLVGRVATGASTAALVGLVATLAAVAVFAYSRWVLVPKMDEAGDDAFQQYHRQSVLLNGVSMLAVAAALVAAQF